MSMNFLKPGHLEKRKYIILPRIFKASIVALLFPKYHFFNMNEDSAGIIGPPEMLMENNPLTIDEITENTEIHIDIPEFGADLEPRGRLNRKNHILYPEDASSNRAPENEVAQWFAENTELIDTVLTGSYTGRPVLFKYRTDDDIFDNPPDSDMWQNPDYYLVNSNDIEDFSVASTSIPGIKRIPADVIGVNQIHEREHWPDVFSCTPVYVSMAS